MKKRMYAYLVLSGLLCGIFAMGRVEAAQDDVKEFKLNPYLVTATRYETRELEIPASTEVFDSDKIARLGAVNALEVVRNIPGFTITAPPTGSTYIGFRGMAKDNVAVLVNGIPLMQDGNSDLESISTELIERIEVVKGGSAVLYGSNAAAGVVNIITKEKAKSKVKLSLGDNDKFNSVVNIGTDKFSINYNHEQSKDRGFIYKSRRGYYLGDKLEKDTLNMRYNYDEHLNFQYIHTDKTADVSQINSGVISPYFHSVTKYNMGQITYNNNDLRAIMYYRDRDWVFDSTRMYSNPKGHNYGIDVQNKWDLGKLDLTVGSSYEHEETKNDMDRDADKRDQAAIFFLTDTPIGERTNLILGARENYVEESGSTFCPQLQILHNIAEDSNIFLNVNRSMRAPMISEQWATDNQWYNPDLKAEKGWNYEIGWKSSLSDNEMVKFSLYHIDVDDRIYMDSATIDGIEKNIYRNADKYRNTGAELSYEKILSDKYNYNLGLSYGNPEQQLNGGDWERVDFKLGINAGLGMTFGKTSANIFANYMAARVNGIRPMVELNMNIKHKLTENDSLQFNVYNLLDRDDIRTGSSSGTGSLLEERNFLLTYEHLF